MSHDLLPQSQDVSSFSLTRSNTVVSICVFICNYFPKINSQKLKRVRASARTHASRGFCHFFISANLISHKAYIADLICISLITCTAEPCPVCSLTIWSCSPEHCLLKSRAEIFVSLTGVCEGPGDKVAGDRAWLVHPPNPLLQLQLPGKGLPSRTLGEAPAQRLSRDPGRPPEHHSCPSPLPKE